MSDRGRLRNVMARTAGSAMLLTAATGLSATPFTVGSAAATSPNVLLVGSYHGIAGGYSTIQAAVDAAAPGDWILVGPGDYHETQDHTNPTNDEKAAVLITTPGLHLRGMDRNAVVIDGTKPGSAPCASDAASQDLGVDTGGGPQGRNGVVVFEADGVSLENFTACNFLEGGGNQIWWNGGDETGTIHMGSYSGAYLSATNTYNGGPGQQGSYGIFVSNASGPGVITKTYASNMDDASYYIGACQRVCNATLDQAHAENSVLGYSGTNSGGTLTISNGEWNDNKTGIVTNSQIADLPAPQDGACPGTVKVSCWIITGNYIHDNNNPNVPVGVNESPVGTGIVVAGGRHDRVKGNRIENQGSWGVLFAPFPDQTNDPASCTGGWVNFLGSIACYFDDFGNEGASNTFHNVGFFGNVTNGDLADISFSHPGDGNWWHDNTNLDGALTTAPANLESTHGTQYNSAAGATLLDPLTDQVLCATEALNPCPNDATHQYPRRTSVVLKALPTQESMPDPCAGVPANPWCPAVAPTTTTTTSPTTTVVPAAPLATPVRATPALTG